MRTLDGVEVYFDEESCQYGVFNNGRFTGEEFNLFGLCTTADKLTLNACRIWYRYLESGKWAEHSHKSYIAKLKRDTLAEENDPIGKFGSPGSCSCGNLTNDNTCICQDCRDIIPF